LFYRSKAEVFGGSWSEKMNKNMFQKDTFFQSFVLVFF